MNIQLDFMDAPPPYQRHSATSKQAARAIEPKVGTLRRQVLEYIKSAGKTGASDEEIQIGLNMNPSTQRPRRIELARAGLIRYLVETRKTTSGRNAVVWIAEKI